MLDNVDLTEIVLVDPNDVVTLNVAQIKEYEKIAERNKVLEVQVKEFERIIKEMELTKKQNETVS